MTTVLITGAGSGLGAYLTEFLTRVGFHVVATDIAKTKTYLDVTSAAQCREAAERVQPDIWITRILGPCAWGVGVRGNKIWCSVFHTRHCK